jgi:phosphosulfolactate synthase (CoM biosynthesis protein A)
MRNSLFALKALFVAPYVWVGVILLTLFFLPCQSQVVTSSDDETWRNNYQHAPENNENAVRPNIPNRTYAQTTGVRDDYVDPIDSVRQMIDASLPIVKRLAEQKRLVINKADIEKLMSVMNFQVNGRKYGYHELSDSQRRNFKRSDFQQLYDILIFVDKSLSEMQNRQMVNSDIRYVVSMEKISQDLLSSNFFGRIYPTMIVYAIKNNSNDAAIFQNTIISVYGEIDLLNNNRYKDFQPKSIEELEGITNQTFLAVVANNNENTEIRLAAVQRLENQTALANIAYNDSDIQIRLEAVKRLDNQTFLANVAYNNSFVQVRLAALRKLTNKTSIANVAYNDRDVQIRLEAVKRLDNQTSLANVAYNDRDTQVRFAAVKKLTNQTTLSNIAYNDKDVQIRLFAVKKLDNQTSLANVAYNDRDAQVRFAAVKKLTNQTTLSNIAYNDKDVQIRLFAVQQLDNQMSLANVAYNDRDVQIRLAAVQKLTNRTALSNIAKNDRDEQVRDAATKRLNSL